MSESNEQSYYEIALTNRQVLVAFVLILGSVVAAFLGGVWLGRKGGGPMGPLLANELGATGEEAGGDPLAQLEEVGFFGQEEKVSDLKKPDLSRLLEKPDKDSTLAQDVGSAKKAPKRQLTDEEREKRRRRAQQKKRQQAQAEAEAAKAAPPPKAAPPKAAPPPPSPPPPKAAPPPPPTAAPPPPRLDDDDLVIQVFSTREEPQAKKVLDQMKSGGFQAFISPVTVDGKTMYRVRLGPFDERGDAEQVAATVNSRYKLDTWITAASN